MQNGSGNFTAATVRTRQISSQQVQALIEEGVTLIDVRRAEEWQSTGVIDGSILLTFFDASGGSDAAAWVEKMKSMITVEQPLILFCRGGYRSDLVCEFLQSIGYAGQLYNAREGILGWLSEQRPVVRPDQLQAS